jgi:Transposase DDE domain
MVAMVALAAGKEAFSDYSHKSSPHKFTRPQLFACLVLKEFEKKDYRGVCQLLTDCSDLRNAIGLKTVPHYTTVQKASRRLLKLDRVRQLIDTTFAWIHPRSKVVAHAAADSSGFDAHHTSRYFVWRTSGRTRQKGPKKRTSYKRFGKLMLAVNTATHAIMAAVPSVGPTPDIDQLEEVLDQVPQSITIKRMVLDAGFDSAYNHQLLRDYHGILSVIPPLHGRPPKDPNALPSDKYRRLMKTRFNIKAYRRRGQIETVISMLKRNLGSALRGRSYWSRCRDLLLRVVTHNIMLVQ